MGVSGRSSVTGNVSTWPYTEEEEAKTMVVDGCSASASRTRCVARMLASEAVAKSRQDARTPGRAARWNTTSASATMWERSIRLRSPSTNSKAGWAASLVTRARRPDVS